LQHFLQVWGDAQLVLDLGPKLTCEECGALAALLRAHALTDAAAVLEASHADGDDVGDEHYRAPRLDGAIHDD
jgi:hypothetical protein